MTTINYSETINIEREKANLICLIRLTLNALIDQSLSTASLLVLDDHNADVTNFIIVLERVLCFRMRASWLSDRRYFWDFIRPACIGSCRQSIIERVEEISNIHSVKYKGRTWIKFALMEKKLSELLKLVISDCHLVRKFYHDDSIMISSQAFILCDQLAGLNTIDFSFCFKQDNSIIGPLLSNDAEIDVIDITPFLCFKAKQIKQLRINRNSNEETKELSSTAITTNELNSKERTMIPLEKYKLEVEQRKYFEELLQHRDRELQQLKIRYETLKSERESEIVQMENIILELQLELRAARDEADIRHRRSQQLSSGTPPKNSSSFDDRKVNPSSSPLNNDHSENHDTQMNAIDSSLTIADNQNLNFTVKDTSQEQPDDIIYSSYIDSTHSTTTTSTDDDTDESTSKISSNTNNDSYQTDNQVQIASSAEILVSTTSISIPLSSSEDEDKPQVQTVTTTTTDENRSITNESF